MPIRYEKFITREMMKSEPDTLWVFGDNNERTGFGGQAKHMRGEPNAVGVRTKMKASHAPGSYMTDLTFHDNVKMILEDFEPVLNHLRSGKKVVFPTDGIGTGLANLKTHAPRTLDFIWEYVDWLDTYAASI